MTDKAKWAGIYLLLCFVPLFVYFSNPLSHNITAHVAVTGFLFFVPYVGLALIAVLGLQINQTRIFWASLFFFGLYHYLWHPTSFLVLDIQRIKSFEIIAAAFPLTLCVIFLMKECRLWSDQSLARFFLALTPFLVFICLSSWASDLFSELFYWHSLPSTGTLKIPNLTWVSTGIFLLVVFYLPDPKIKGFLTALATTLIPLFFTLQASLLNKFSSDKLSAVFYVIVSFSTITVILLHAVLHTYWKKVYQDVLTGVPNRQALDERLHTLSGKYALSMVDIDHFKKFNDTYGHAEGDNVLRMVAMHLQDSLGPRVYRYGG
ncbi:MAG TPA: GGDEF domain-containing protein, partial [bacterium]